MRQYKKAQNIINNSEKQKLAKSYKKVVSKARKKADNILYLYVQIMFMSVLMLTSFMLKKSNNDTFLFAKDNYIQVFETDSYMESTFSYNTFVKKMKDELQIRFGQLVTAFNNISGKGSANIYPSNVSCDKYYLENKGVTPADGYISSPYGIRTNPFNSKEKEFHTGLDIAAPKGTFIKASFSGVVTKSEWSNIAGNYIKIQSDDGISTMYAHNQFLLVQEGEHVLAGQVIATMGATGNATGPHVHFEFLVDGIRYNPIYALSI